MAIQEFTTTVLIRRGDRTGFVSVKVAPEESIAEYYGIRSQEEYEAYVHYTLAKEEELLGVLTLGSFPQEILFGEQPHPEAVVTYDLTGGAREPRCRCIFQENGGWACVWLRD